MGLSQGKAGQANAHLLATELRVLIGQLARRLREQARPGDYTSSQKAVVLRLERDGPATISTLARAEGVRPQSMGATIASLAEAGLVEGSADPADGRQTLLTLTKACREMLRSRRAAREDWLFRALQAKLTAAEQAKLNCAAELLKRLLETQ